MSLYRCERCHFLREVHSCPVCRIMDEGKKKKEKRIEQVADDIGKTAAKLNDVLKGGRK